VRFAKGGNAGRAGWFLFEKPPHEDRGAENQATCGEFADPPGTEQKARVDRAAHRPGMVENRLKNMSLSSVPVIIENPTI
jgi:hypothetical protein